MANNIAGLLEARDRMASALDKLERAIRDLEGLPSDECAECHDCGTMFDRSTGYLVRCPCREAGYDEQRAAQGN
jgi:hypothetical protein